MKSSTYAVILAGGSGVRFWPASRSARPKQLLCLPLGATVPLLLATAKRLSLMIPRERILISTCASLVESIAALLPDIPRGNYLVEPVPRNTAPCIGWAALAVAQRDPEAIVVVLPSDHLVLDDSAFCEALTSSFAGARHGKLTVLGVPPTRPETGYGYIEVGESLMSGVHRAVRFMEKPNADLAQQLVMGKKHLWNTGMCIFRPETMRKAIAQHMPVLASGLTRFVQAIHRANEQEAQAIFSEFPAISIDYGVLEKACNVAVVPAQFGWSDVGSWRSAWETAPHDTEDNVLPEEGMALEATGNLVYDLSQDSGRLWALFGVHDLVIVNTNDAVLIFPRERSQEVGRVVAQLRIRNKQQYL